MKALCAFAIAATIFVTIAAGQTEFDKGFDKPWTNPKRAFVLDARYYNEINWDELAKDSRVAGVILRSTGGQWNKKKKKWEIIADSQYQGIRKEAKKRGYLWGSFHVGMSTKIQSAKEQARFYLDNIDQLSDEVMALDLEDFSKSQYMDLEGAREFIQYIFDKTGRYPLVYVTGSVYDIIVKKERDNKNSVFAKTPLWYVRVDDNIEKYFKNAPKEWWTTYTLWQFASELNCCRKVRGKQVCPVKTCPFERNPPETRVPRVPGVAYDMDINIYNGSVEDLKKAWLSDFKR